MCVCVCVCFSIANMQGLTVLVKLLSFISFFLFLFLSLDACILSFNLFYLSLSVRMSSFLSSIFVLLSSFPFDVFSIIN